MFSSEMKTERFKCQSCKALFEATHNAHIKLDLSRFICNDCQNNLPHGRTAQLSYKEAKAP